MAKITFMKTHSTSVVQAFVLAWKCSFINNIAWILFHTAQESCLHSDGVKIVSEAKGKTTPPECMTFLVCYVLNPVDYKFLYIQIRQNKII